MAEGLYHELGRDMREDGERLLNRIESLLPHAGPSVKTLRIGAPADVIATTVEEEQADLVLLGARGLGPIKERVFGSVSHRVFNAGVLRQTDCQWAGQIHATGTPRSAKCR